jgi:transposase
MMGTQPSQYQPALFAYHIDLEHRVAADHLLRRVLRVLDLSFVLPIVRPHYGRCGNVSLDPRLIMKMLLLLFLYNIRSERELMEQIGVRLDFLWFLGLDLDSEIPDHSVLSKARARWGEKVFERLFVRMVQQCVQAGLVNGSLLHVDSTIVKAQASRDSVVSSSPELVSALRQAYQEQELKLEVLPAQPKEPLGSEAQGSEALEPAAAQRGESQDSLPAPACPPSLRVLAVTAVAPAPSPEQPKKKLPVNRTRISTTDPEAELARNKSGVAEPNYKEHRLVDDAHGVITAVAASSSNVPDGSRLPGLYEQHVATTGLKQRQVTLAGDGHYGTASNYLYCAQEGLRAHLAEVSANLEERGKLPLSRFVYEPARDRLRCPAGYYLVLHQDRPEEQAKVYLIEEPAHCAACALRAQCTQAQRGRSIQRHVQAEVIAAARAEAHSPAAGYSRKRRRHVMEGSFADAFNNHGAKKARWRGLRRQQIQSWLIAAVQNLRILLRHQSDPPASAAVVALVRQFPQTNFQSILGQWVRFWTLGDHVWLGWRLRNAAKSYGL